VLPLDVADSELMLAVKSALDLSSHIVPHPVDWKAAVTPRLLAAGVKTERAFQQKSTLLLIFKEHESLRIRPTHNGGSVGDKKDFMS